MKAPGRRKAIFASALVFAFPVWASAVWAREGLPDADAAIARGVELRKAGNDLEALAEFEHAYEISPSPRACAQIGLAELALGRWVDAEAHLTKAMRERDDAWISKQWGPLEMSVALVQPHLGWLSVEANVPGAQLFLDGVYVGTLPMKDDARVSAGSVVAEVRAPGYSDVRRPLIIAPATHMHERILLAPLRINAPPSGGDRNLSTLGWSVLSVGIASVGVGSYFGVRTFAAKSDRDDHCFPGGCDSAGLGFDRDARRDAAISTIGFGIGVVAASAGLFFLLRRGSTPTPIRAAGVF
jgi:hypothetical protein